MNLAQIQCRFLLLKFALQVGLILVMSCREPVKIPLVTTIDAGTTTAFTSSCRGRIVNDGGAAIVSNGVCWSLTEFPDISDDRTIESHEPVNGEFLSYMYGLDAAETYYVRAYATNSAGTGYGEQIRFVTLADNTGQTGTITDIDGNIYKTIGIGSQIWMAENLKVTKYNDGTAIPNITDNSAWSSLSTGAYCDYDNNIEYSEIYGRLYNWKVAASDNPKNVCPIGWHVPAWSELSILPDVKDQINLGGKLKEAEMNLWEPPNTSATNESGFKALPGGIREMNGVFNGIQKYGYWWSSTFYFNPPGFTNNAWSVILSYNNAEIGRNFSQRQSAGLSIRCIKDKN